MDEAADDARAFGLPELAEQIEGADQAEAQAYKVWPENMPIVAAFAAVSSQLNVVPIGGGMAPAKPFYLGLHYAGVEAGLRGAGIEADADMWEGIRVMEAAMCGKLNGVEPPAWEVTAGGA